MQLPDGVLRLRGSCRLEAALQLLALGLLLGSFLLQLRSGFLQLRVGLLLGLRGLWRCVGTQIGN